MKNLKIITLSTLAAMALAMLFFNSAQASRDIKVAPELIGAGEVVLTSEVEWTHLNPKRGDKAPRAGTLWGDLNGTGPTGFLLKPTDGFKSPPHIQNVSVHQVSSEAGDESILYVRTDGRYEVIAAQPKK